MIRFFPSIIAIQGSQRPSRIDFVRNGIANSLMGQWKTFINVQWLFILLCNHTSKTTIFCLYIYNVIFSSFTIKSHTKSILTKHNKLLFLTIISTAVLTKHFKINNKPHKKYFLLNCFFKTTTTISTTIPNTK